jgi:chemotaxis protein methyltransferase CheR
MMLISGDTDKQVDFTDEELNAFVTAVNARFGLDFTDYERKSLRRGLGRLMTRYGFGNLMEVWAKMLQDRSVIIKYVDELMVNLTELFRNPDAWQAVRNEVLPVFEKKESLKIWHAGCSTGEEVYSMAIVLRQKNMQDKTSLIATDLSSQALIEAKEAVYNNMLWERYRINFLKYDPMAAVQMPNFFVREEKHFTITDALKKRITFLRHNLVHEEPIGPCDIIFCRNVMIYFDENLKMKVIKKFHSALRDGGYLIIGYYDITPEAFKLLFEPVNASARIYRKISTVRRVSDL